VQFSEKTISATAASDTARPKYNLYASLLLGMVAMFLLYIADNAVRDLYRELNGHTLARFRTVHRGLTAFIAAKTTFAVVMVLIGAAVLLGGGAVLFGFQWSRMPQMAAMLLAYSVFASGFMALVAGVAGSEKRAGMFNNILVMGLALGSGCMFPLDMLGAFWQHAVAPWIPVTWFLEAVRQMQYASGDVAWIMPALKLAAAGAICVALSAALFRRRLEQGVKA
jgi:ABC-2 type transport system permease protein